MWAQRLVEPSTLKSFFDDQVLGTEDHPLTQLDEVAQTAIDAIVEDTFRARPRVDDEKHRETVEWEAGIYRSRAEALMERSAPNCYLWGPGSDLLGPGTS